LNIEENLQQNTVNSGGCNFSLPPYKIGHQAQKQAIFICENNNYG
jgi:hypothetical protein